MIYGFVGTGTISEAMVVGMIDVSNLRTPDR